MGVQRLHTLIIPLRAGAHWRFPRFIAWPSEPHCAPGGAFSGFVKCECPVQGLRILSYRTVIHKTSGSCHPADALRNARGPTVASVAR